MASKLKRISEQAEARVTAIAAKENRTFVAQMDRIVEAGIEALGLEDGEPTEQTRPTAKAS